MIIPLEPIDLLVNFNMPWTNTVGPDFSGWKKIKCPNMWGECAYI